MAADSGLPSGPAEADVLSSAEPPSVQRIRAARRLLERNRRGAGLAVLVILALAWGLSGLYTVATDETAAVLRFGELVADAVGPGIHWSVPGGVDEVVQVATGEVFRQPVQDDWEPELGLVTSDENLIEATLVVQYRVSDLGDYLFATEDAEILVEQVVRAVLVEAFATTPVDDVLTSAKASIQNQVRERAQDQLDIYESGLTLVAVNLQAVNPPPEAAGAFRAVSDSRAEAAQAINRAQGERERSSRLAGGEASQLVQEARTAADARTQGAQGAAERFGSLLRQYQRSPGQTRSEIYNEILMKVLPQARLIVLAPGEKPEIDVQLMEPRTDSRRPPSFEEP